MLVVDLISKLREFPERAMVVLESQTVDGRYEIEDVEMTPTGSVLIT
jgi:hypothetical protein